MKQLEYLNEAIGKTITESFLQDARLGLRFSDDSFLVIGCRYGDGDSAYFAIENGNHTYDTDELALGFITPDEARRRADVRRRELRQSLMRRRRRDFDSIINEIRERGQP